MLLEIGLLGNRSHFKKEVLISAQDFPSNRVAQAQAQDISLSPIKQAYGLSLDLPNCSDQCKPWWTPSRYDVIKI